jgi:DNA-binding CsgD family transcriptional regulator
VVSLEDARSRRLCLFAVRRIFEDVMRLRRLDLEQVLDFLGDVAGLESAEPYPFDFLTRLQDLIACDSVLYQEFEYRARCSRLLVWVGLEGPCRWEPATGSEPNKDDDRYWRVGPCPIVHYRLDEGELAAIRMSDVAPGSRFRELPVYREHFGPDGVDKMLDLGLPERSPRQRSLILMRAEDSSDFSERDRTVLELLRPHLYRLETQAALRQQLAEALHKQDADAHDGGAYAELTPREREVVELVARGKTNAEIAVELWVAPSTIKKHLEHIYGKLGVGRRAGAATLVRAAR